MEQNKIADLLNWQLCADVTADEKLHTAALCFIAATPTTLKFKMATLVKLLKFYLTQFFHYNDWALRKEINT